MPWYAHIAWRHLFPEGKRFPLFTAISLLGVSLGVTAMVVVISVFNGFGYEIRKRIAEFDGDIRVVSSGILYDWESAVEAIKSVPEVESVSKYATGMVIAQFGNRPTYPVVRGIDTTDDSELNPIRKFVVDGSIDDLDHDSVFLSPGVAGALRVRVGDEIEIYSPLLLNKLKSNEVILPQVVRVVGIVETSWNELDPNTIYCSLRMMQDLYGLGRGVHGIQVRIKNGENPNGVAKKINRVIDQSLLSRGSLFFHQGYMSVIQTEKRMMFFLMFLIVIVASFSIASSLFTAVVRKTREVGLYSALGASRFEIASCFCLQGLFIGVVGALLGYLLGFTILGFRNEITDFIAQSLGALDTMMEYYPFTYWPVYIDTFDLVTIGVLTVGISTCAGFFPALKAGRLKPVEALRNE